MEHAMQVLSLQETNFLQLLVQNVDLFVFFMKSIGSFIEFPQFSTTTTSFITKIKVKIKFTT